jgi:HD-GYP domain-containing protein (c-di-GMP phosphodiesterase class II)
MLIDSYDTRSAEKLLLVGRTRHSGGDGARQLLIAEGTAAAAFIAAATVLAALAFSPRSRSLPAIALTVVAYVLAGSVRYPVGSAWTAPTQLVFVPMLFVLPPPLVPLVVAGCSVADQVPDAVHGRIAPTRVFARLADGFYSLGPAIVFVLFDVSGFSWGRWPVYVLAFLAQIVIDAGSGLARTSAAERIAPSRQLPMLWLYVTDLCLGCMGLLVAASAVDEPAVLVLTLPIIGFVWLLGREREQRLDYSLALSTAYRGTAELISYVIEADNQSGAAHGRDVVDLSRSVADALKLDKTERRILEFVAMLHDIGKVAVPRQILNKAGRLDEVDREMIRRHTVEGEQILEQLGGALARVKLYVRATHEHYDGRGYPDGLAGERIPIQSRIVAACDAFSAMTNDRPYRPAMPIREALAELRVCAGRQFDPQVVHAIERVVG